MSTRIGANTRVRDIVDRDVVYVFREVEYVPEWYEINGDEVGVVINAFNAKGLIWSGSTGAGLNQRFISVVRAARDTWAIENQR